MAGKISTIIIKVDLDCHLCYKQIRKAISKLQERERIQTIAYDEKNKKVTISGPFDPNKLSEKLCCKACKVIKDIQIVEIQEKEKPKEEEKSKRSKSNKEKPKDVKPDEEKPKDVKPAELPTPNSEKPKDPEAELPKPNIEKPKDPEPAEPDKTKKPAAEPSKLEEKIKPEEEKPKPTPEPDLPEASPVDPAPEPVDLAPPGLVYQPGWPVGPVCGCGPSYEAYYGGCRCCACGRTYGWVAGGPPGEGYKPCHFFSEEDPSTTCNIM